MSKNSYQSVKSDFWSAIMWIIIAIVAIILLVTTPIASWIGAIFANLGTILIVAVACVVLYYIAGAIYHPYYVAEQNRKLEEFKTRQAAEKAEKEAADRRAKKERFM